MKKFITTNFIVGLILVCIPSKVIEYKAPIPLLETPIIVNSASKQHKFTVLTHYAPPLETIVKYAKLYKVSQETMLKVIECESNNNPHAIGDGGKSFGIVQIYLPSHPDIIKEQALDPDFAIDFLAKNLAQNKGNMWTCFRSLKVV